MGLHPALNEAQLDEIIVQDVIYVQACVCAVWEVLVASSRNASYRAGTVALSDAVFWKALVACGSYADSVPEPSSKIRAPKFELTIGSSYATHAIPSADFHQKPRDLVRNVWAERNAALIQRTEKQEVIIVPATWPVASLFMEGHRAERIPKMPEREGETIRMVYLDSGAQVLLWKPPLGRIKYYRQKIRLEEPHGLYAKMREALTACRTQ